MWTRWMDRAQGNSIISTNVIVHMRTIVTCSWLYHFIKYILPACILKVNINVLNPCCSDAKDFNLDLIRG